MKPEMVGVKPHQDQSLLGVYNNLVLNSNFAWSIFTWKSHQGPVVQKVDNAIHRINHYPADSVVCFVNTGLLDSDLSSG